MQLNILEIIQNFTCQHVSVWNNLQQHNLFVQNNVLPSFIEEFYFLALCENLHCLLKSIFLNPHFAYNVQSSLDKKVMCIKNLTLSLRFQTLT
jgi:hypothetical protein